MRKLAAVAFLPDILGLNLNFSSLIRGRGKKVPLQLQMGSNNCNKYQDLLDWRSKSF